jgi:hypothetical protein
MTDLIDKLRFMPSDIYDAARTMDLAADEIEHLREELAQMALMTDYYSQTEIDAYIAERNAALLGSLDNFAAFCAKRGAFHRPEIREISYHQLRTGCTGLPMDARISSKRWLLEHNMKSWDDGNVPTSGDALNERP